MNIKDICDTVPTVYNPHPRRLERLTICRCYYKASTFSSVILRSCGRSQTHDLPHGSPVLNQLTHRCAAFGPNLHPSREHKGKANNEIPWSVAKWGREGLEFEG